MRYDGDSLTVEVADTPETRAEGLADRDSLAHDSGMLFDLGPPARRAFGYRGNCSAGDPRGGGTFPVTPTTR